MHDRNRLRDFSHNALPLVRNGLGKHRKRRPLRSGFLCNREVTGPETQSFLRLREVKRDQIVNPCANVGLVQTFLELRPITYPQHFCTLQSRRGKKHSSQEDNIQKLRQRTGNEPTPKKRFAESD